MSAVPPSGTRVAVYARHSTASQDASLAKAPRAADPRRIDPAQAAVVRQIYTDYAAGMSILAIAQALNDADREVAR